MRFFKSKFRNNLIVACVILGTIPTIIVGTFASYISAKSVQEKVSDGNIRSLTQAQISIEQQLITADSVMLQFLESSTVRKSSNTPLKGIEFEIFDDLDRSMFSLPITRLNIKNISLTNVQMNWTVNNEFNYKFDDYEKVDNIIDVYNRIGRSSVWIDKFDFKTGEKNTYSDCITLAKKSLNSNNLCIVTLRVPYSSLNELVSHNTGAGSIMVVSDSGCVVESEKLSSCGKSILTTDLFKKLKEQKTASGNFKVIYNNVESYVSYIKSDYNNWSYLSIWSLSEMTKQEKVIGWFTAGVCIFIIIIIFLSSLIISNRIYLPIGRIYGSFKNKEDITKKHPRGKDELALIEENVSQLLTDQTKLDTQIYKQITQLKEYFTMKLLLDEMSQTFITSKVNLFGYSPKPEKMVVLSISIDSLKGTQYNENDRDLLLYAVNNIVNELFEGKIVTTPVIVFDRQFTILNVDNDYKNSTYLNGVELQKTMLRELDFTVSIGVSSVLDSYSDIHRGYNESIEASQYQLLLGSNSIIFFDDIIQNRKLKPVYPSETEQEIIDAVRFCDRIKCSEMIHQFIENVFKYEANKHEYKVFVQRLWLNLIILQKSVGGDSQKLNTSYLDKFTCLRNTTDIENWLRDEVAESVIQSIEQFEGDGFKKICEDTLEIIHKEFESKLTLEDCASRLNYHPSYIRRVLKKEMGINFSDYLLRYRINVSKKWLVDSELRISDIALRLKYENTENFIRSFKKIVGLTPGQFREEKNKKYDV